MVLKATENSLKKKLLEKNIFDTKKFYEKKMGKKNFFRNFLKVGNFLNFLRSCEKQCCLHLEHIDQLAICAPMQCLAWCNNCCYISKYHCAPYRRLLFVQDITIIYIRATACPVQIRAHHHIDVYTDINENKDHLPLPSPLNFITYVTRLNVYLKYTHFLLILIIADYPVIDFVINDRDLTLSVLIYPLRVRWNQFNHPQTCGKLACVNIAISKWNKDNGPQWNLYYMW